MSKDNNDSIDNDEPLATPYSGAYRRDLDKEEPDTEENEEDTSEEEEEDNDDAPLSNRPNAELDDAVARNKAVAEDYEARYKNLRSWSNRKINELNAKIEALANQAPKGSALNNIELPSTAEELEEFSKKYPQVMKAIETVAILKSRDTSKVLEEKFAEIEKDRKKLARKEAEMQIRAKHSDWDSIKTSEEFHTWLESKSARTQESIYDNATDFAWAIETIDLYKAETNKTPKRGRPPAKEQEDAAMAVRSKGGAPTPEGSNKEYFLESQISKMKPHEYAKNEKAIDKAMREGRVILDLSGGGRHQPYQPMS